MANGFLLWTWPTGFCCGVVMFGFSNAGVCVAVLRRLGGRSRSANRKGKSVYQGATRLGLRRMSAHGAWSFQGALGVFLALFFWGGARLLALSPQNGVATSPARARAKRQEWKTADANNNWHTRLVRRGRGERARRRRAPRSADIAHLRGRCGRSARRATAARCTMAMLREGLFKSGAGALRARAACGSALSTAPEAGRAKGEGEGEHTQPSSCSALARAQAESDVRGVECAQ